MTPSNNDTPQLNVEASSFEEKNRHSWVDAQPADPVDAKPVENEEHNRLGASVYTPNEYHNQSGPRAELRPDLSTVPSLMLLAATLGIPLLAGERLIDGESSADEEIDEGAGDDTSLDASVFLDPSVLLDE